MISWIVDQLLKLPAAAALAFVFILPALEASIFLGFILPGETAVVVGGFFAYEGKLPVALVIAVASVGAILGDSAGYAIGHRWGDSLLDKAPKRFVKPAHIEQGKRLINRLGGRSVFIGRWTAVLRALVPSLCGTARMEYRSFLLWNAVGGVTWAVAFSLVGYLAGSAWQRVEGYTNTAGYIVFGVLLVAVIGFAVFNRRRQHRKDREVEAEMATDANGDGEPETGAHTGENETNAATAEPVGAPESELTDTQTPEPEQAEVQAQAQAAQEEAQQSGRLQS
jgi:membrane protein DedA with SNARE-associated domain